MTWEEGTKDFVDGYYTSKKLAEKAAWDFMENEKPHFALTTLCPPYVSRKGHWVTELVLTSSSRYSVRQSRKLRLLTN